MGFWENFERDKKLIVAHRGARSIRPENTMSAFKMEFLLLSMIIR